MTVQLKKTITIIVATLVVENDDILMMQEAKPECYGLWYLPAGRLERHESLVVNTWHIGRYGQWRAVLGNDVLVLNLRVFNERVVFEESGWPLIDG